MDDHKREQSLQNKIRNLEKEISELKKTNLLLKDKEEDIAVLLENSPDIIYRTDLEGKIVYINASVKNLTGYTIEEAVGMNMAQEVYYLPEKRRQFLQELQKTGKVENFEARLKRKDGSIWWASTNAHFYKDKNGTIQGIEGITRDITRQKESEQESQKLGELLNAAISQSPSGVLIADAPNVTIRLANPAALGIRGSSKSRLTEIDVKEHSINWQTFRPDGTQYPPEELPLSRAVLKGETTENEEVIIRDESGDDRWVSVNAAPIFDSEQNITAGIVIFHDITERKKADDELSQIFSLSLDMICIADINTMTFTKINPAFQEILGYTEQELLGRSFIEFVHPDDVESTISITEEKLRQGEKVINFKNRYTCKDGSCRWLNWVSHPVREKGVTYAVAHDITEEIKAEEEKSKLQEQLQHAQKMDALGKLAGGIAHDFNNILMVIQGRTSLLMAETDPMSPQYEHLQGIEENVVSASDLSKQLLGIARGGKYELKIVNPNVLVESSSQMFGRTKKEIQIHKSFDDDAWNCEADPGQIKQVLLNLYVNAWQAMPNGGHLYLKTENVILDEAFKKSHQLKLFKYIKISVIDTGIGMDKATQQRIFDPFFTTKEMSRGVGLGLASAYGIMKNHGGAINVYSEKGRGAAFELYLPAADKELQAERELDSRIITGDETVLLVDDEEMIRMVGSQMLENLGYKVFTAENGTEGIEIFKEHQHNIQLVILDMIMPGLGGGETFDQLKKINSSVKVLLSSGYSIDGDAKDILSRGCAGFIQKPFNLNEVSQKLRSILDN